MVLWQALILGFVVGVTELLPISGMAHSRFFEVLLGIDHGSQGILRPMVYLGITFAVLLVYRKDIASMLHTLFALPRYRRSIGRGRRVSMAAMQNRQMLRSVLFGALPLLALLLLRSYITSLETSLFFAAAMLAVTGAVVYSTRMPQQGAAPKPVPDTSDALLIGMAQLPAALPGLSRTGLTVSLGMWRGLDGVGAVRFSCLLAVPAFLGAAILEFSQKTAPMADGAFWLGAAGFATAAIGAYLAIRFLRFVMRRHAFASFAYYCWGIGLVMFLLALIYV